jgi:hypothetical protein
MRLLLSFSFTVISAGLSASAQTPGAMALSADAPRQTILFDRAWQFVVPGIGTIHGF